MFKRCNICFHINDFDKNLYTFNCSLCSNNDQEEFEEYPVRAVKGFLEQASVNVFGSDDINQYMFHELQSACLFLCSLYEILLESTLADYLKKMGTQDSVYELLLESNQGQDKLTKYSPGAMLCSLYLEHSEFSIGTS